MSFRKGLLNKIACAGFLMVCTASAGELQEKLVFSGFVSMEGGQFVKFKYQAVDYLHQWLQKNLLGLGINTTVHPRVNLSLNVVGSLTYNTMPRPDVNLLSAANAFLSPLTGFSLDRAEIMLNLSPEVQDSLLKISIGIFPYKYNSEVRNLGEYLFRSGAYPGYIDQGGFDAPFAQIAGIQATVNLFDRWRNDLLLTSELWQPPYNDFSVTYLTDVSIVKKVFDIGGGIQFYRCFPVDPNQTQPKVMSPMQPSFAAPNYWGRTLDSIGFDSATMSTIFDTTYGGWYTYAGTKLMARFTFDPKPLLGLDIFGAEDMKLYSEVAILGLKNYPANPNQDGNTNLPVNQFGYDKLIQKMPIMVGFNFPAFKLLDVLSLEIEYYGKKYVNAVPIPFNQTSWYYPAPPLSYYTWSPPVSDPTYADEFYAQRVFQWKWSVYAKRTLFNRFTITAQAARDHIRNTISGVATGNFDREEALVKAKHWYWMVKFGCNF